MDVQNKLASRPADTLVIQTFIGHVDQAGSEIAAQTIAVLRVSAARRRTLACVSAAAPAQGVFAVSGNRPNSWYRERSYSEV